MKYDNYKLKRNDYLRCSLEYILIITVISYLFYDSFYAFLFFLIIFPLYLKRYKDKNRLRIQGELKEDFIKLLQGVSASLSAGLSVENSFREGLKELINLNDDKESIMIREIKSILYRIENGSRIEDELSDFASRCEIDEIRDCVTVFKIARQSGGRFKDVFNDCVSLMKSKQDTQAQIQILISGKQYEQKIMNIMPFGMIFILRMTSDELLSSLYHNLFGATIMTVLLAIYIAAFALSEKISDIRC